MLPEFDWKSYEALCRDVLAKRLERFYLNGGGNGGYPVLFYVLINCDICQEALGVARIISRQVWVEDSFEECSPAEWATHRTRIEELAAGRVVPDHLFARYYKLGGCEEHFDTYDEAARNIVSRAADLMVDGAWLQATGGPAYVCDEAAVVLFNIYAEELGEGRLVENHVHLIERLFEQVGYPIPPIDSEEFQYSKLPVFRSWGTACEQMLLSMGHEKFRWVLHANFVIENSATHQFKPYIEALREHGIDPYYYLLHVTIDNPLTGHGQQAWIAFEHWIKQQCHPNSGQAHRDRIARFIKNMLMARNGLPHLERAPDYTQREVPDFFPECAIDRTVRTEPANPHERMLQLVHKKAPMGRWLHSHTMVNGHELGPLFDEPERLMAELRRSTFITAGDPERSTLVRSADYGAKMFKIFTDDELKVIKEWIASLPPGTDDDDSPLAAPPDTAALPPLQTATLELMTSRISLSAPVNDWLAKSASQRFANATAAEQFHALVFAQDNPDALELARLITARHHEETGPLHPTAGSVRISALARALADASPVLSVPDLPADGLLHLVGLSWLNPALATGFHVNRSRMELLKLMHCAAGYGDPDKSFGVRVKRMLSSAVDADCIHMNPLFLEQFSESALRLPRYLVALGLRHRELYPELLGAVLWQCAAALPPLVAALGTSYQAAWDGVAAMKCVGAALEHAQAACPESSVSLCNGVLCGFMTCDRLSASTKVSASGRAVLHAFCEGTLVDRRATGAPPADAAAPSSDAAAVGSMSPEELRQAAEDIVARYSARATGKHHMVPMADGKTFDDVLAAGPGALLDALQAPDLQKRFVKSLRAGAMSRVFTPSEITTMLTYFGNH